MQSNMNFVPVLPAKSQSPKSAHGGGSAQPVLRDNFTITTWLAIGALAQGLAFLIAGRAALLPALCYIVYSCADTGLQVRGLKSNPHMEGVLMQKVSAQLPDSTGAFGSKPANRDVVVFLIGARCNHPLGMLAPGFKELGDNFTGMIKDLESHKAEFGFLGATSWVNASARSTNNELLTVGYFETVEGLQRFAHSEYHSKAWKWWNKNYKSHRHMSIWHETYDVPKGRWETIYVNSHASGLGSASVVVKDEKTGIETYASTLVDASKGVLKTAAGRMARSTKTDEHQGLGIVDPY